MTKEMIIKAEVRKLNPETRALVLEYKDLILNKRMDEIEKVLETPFLSLYPRDFVLRRGLDYGRQALDLAFELACCELGAA